MKQKTVRNVLLCMLFLWLSQTTPALAAGHTDPSGKAADSAEQVTGQENDREGETAGQEQEAGGENRSEEATDPENERGEIQNPDQESDARPSLSESTWRPEETDPKNILYGMPETRAAVSGGKVEKESTFPVPWVAAGFAAGMLAAMSVLAAVKGLSAKRGANVRENVEKDDFDPVNPPEENGMEQQVRSSVLPVSPRKLPDPTKGSIGQVYHIGRRKQQQDNYGTKMTRLGLLSVVSDGMGGLSDGDKVSAAAVKGMLQASDSVASGRENPLFEMTGRTNQNITKMLGPEKVYKCGATLLAVLIGNGVFHWVSVGDSRIYFYCDHHLLQMNREHIYKWQLLQGAVNQSVSFAALNADPQRNRLVSFLGMGDLKAVDGSLRPVRYRPGDQLLLMSDGIFNTLSETEICRILDGTQNAAQAAEEVERQVLAAGNPGQDNFTCIILDL